MTLQPLNTPADPGFAGGPLKALAKNHGIGTGRRWLLSSASASRIG